MKISPIRFLFLFATTMIFSCQKESSVENGGGSNAVLPTITTATVSSISNSTAVSGGNISSDGGAAITTRGICWSASPNPDITTTHTTDGTGTGVFMSGMNGLTASTTYYVRAYAVNSAGIAYGNEINFTTSTITTLATVSTNTASSITANSATCGGNVLTDGGNPVTARGVCWGTTTGPLVSGSHTTDGSGIGAFNSSIAGLTVNTVYYVRAYATNALGTAYGNEVSFTASNAATIPTITTTAASAITSTAASSGGNITSDGGSAVTVRGVCWSTSVNPVVTGNHTTDGTGTGIFTSSIASLTASTTYYVRAYATNSVGTAYGNEINFVTSGSSSSGKIFYEKWSSGVSVEIYAANPDGTGEQKLTNVSSGNTREAFFARFSGDSSKIIFQNWPYGTSNGGYLMQMNLDGTGITQIASNLTNVLWHQVYQNGQKLLYCVDTLVAAPGFPSIHVGQIFTANLDGTGIVKLTSVAGGNLNPDGSCLEPVINKTNATIVYKREISNDIWLMNTDGTNKHSIVPSSSSINNFNGFSFSPDGTKILFMANFGASGPIPHREIYIMNSDGTNITRLTDFSVNGTVMSENFGPCFSRNGTKIYFNGYENGSGPFQLYVMNMDGSGKTKLTTDAFNHTEPIVNF